MNEQIKELAEQAGVEYSSQWTYWTAHEPELERFAELIRQDETKACAKHYLEIMRDAVEQAVLKERDKCAQLLDDFAKTEMVPVKDTWRMGVMAAANAVRDKK